MEALGMSRLIVISNRVNRPTKTGNQGGLAVALSQALRESRGIWVGWSGEVTENFTGQIGSSEAEGVTTATIDMGAQDGDEFYNSSEERPVGKDDVSTYHYVWDVTI